MLIFQKLFNLFKTKTPTMLIQTRTPIIAANGVSYQPIACRPRIVNGGICITNFCNYLYMLEESNVAGVYRRADNTDLTDADLAGYSSLPSYIDVRAI